MTKSHCKILLLILSIFLSPESINAHPHIFLANRITAIFNENGLEGFHATWTADEFSTAGLLDGYDENENGKVDRHELKLFETDSVTNLKSSNYFTSISIDQKPFKVSQVKNFTASLSGNKIIYSFFIPCASTATDNAKEITIAQYDSSYFTFIGFEKKSPATIKKSTGIEVSYKIDENKNETYYFGMLHPVALILRFKKQ